MKATHTPGPWNHSLNGLARNSLGEPQYTVGPSMLAVATVHNKENDDGATAEANARLIAAAPTMLDALKRAETALTILRSHHENLGDHFDGWASEALPFVRAAISKATHE